MTDAGEGFPPEHRLRRRGEFLHVQRRGQRIHTPHYVIVLLRDDARSPDDPGLRRIGITVTKKVAGAVGRNRVKRVVREVFRRNRELFPESCDIVVIAKSGSPELGYDAAREEIAKVRRPMKRAAERRR